MICQLDVQHQAVPEGHLPAAQEDQVAVGQVVDLAIIQAATQVALESQHPNHLQKTAEMQEQQLEAVQDAQQERMLRRKR